MKPLGERGDRDPGATGEGEVNRFRKVSTPEQIATRVAEFEDIFPATVGVVPLNPGFFQLQRMRSQAAVKEHKAVRAKVRG